MRERWSCLFAPILVIPIQHRISGLKCLVSGRGIIGGLHFPVLLLFLLLMSVQTSREFKNRNHSIFVCLLALRTGRSVAVF